MTRVELLERHRALPLPTTSDEAWRFRNRLKGSTPTRSTSSGGERSPRGSMLDIDVAGLAIEITEDGLELERVPEEA